MGQTSNRYRHGLVVYLSIFVIFGCSSNQSPIVNNQCKADHPLVEITPQSADLSLSRFSEVTQWIQKTKAPLISILLSVNGKLTYEYYASGSDRNTSRNVMSVTKSITSALLGIALERGLISSTNSSVTDYFPSSTQDEHLNKFRKMNIKNIMSMSALDARTWPKTTVKARRMAHEFHVSKNRFNFAIQQKIVNHPGVDFEYTDVTPALISAVLQNVTHKNLFDLANLNLFLPMGFKDQGWLFRDEAGYDNASYGLELRPIDMHKFGVLYLNYGCWEGKQLVPRVWVEESFNPLIKSHPGESELDYGWFWWRHELKPGWRAHLAKGWHGQRLAIFPERGVVISITANATDETEERIIKETFKLLLGTIDNKN